MKRKIIILRIINFILLLTVPISVIFLMALVVVLIQGNTIQKERLIFFLLIVIVTVLAKIIKYRLTKSNPT
jgi:hypothetical protein